MASSLLLRPSRRVLAVALATVLTLPACRGEPQTRVLGVAMGTSLIDAARLAIGDALAEGPIQGLDTVLVPEGSARSGPALEAARSLADTPGLVAVVGHANSAATLVASQVYNERRIVQVAPTSTAAAYSQAGPFSFRLVPPDGRQGAFLAGVVADSFPAGARVALFYVNDDYGRGLRGAFLSALDTARYPVVLQLPHAEEAVGADDVRQGIDALANAAPDVVFWLARPQILQQFLPELRARWAALPVYGGDALATALVMGFPPDLWYGVHFTDFLNPSATPASRAFGERFRERFGQAASGAHLLTYDAVRLILQALEEGVSSGDELRRYLMSLGQDRPPYVGVSGPLTFDENGDVERSYVLRSFQGGGP